MTRSRKRDIISTVSRANFDVCSVEWRTPATPAILMSAREAGRRSPYRTGGQMGRTPTLSRARRSCNIYLHTLWALQVGESCDFLGSIASSVTHRIRYTKFSKETAIRRENCQHQATRVFSLTLRLEAVVGEKLHPLDGLKEE